jgi:DivIVA domain-containing protein
MTPSAPTAFTPEIIRTTVFKRALRGYRREDVDRFLHDIAEYEQAQREVLAEHERERARLQARIAELESHDTQSGRELAGRAMLSAQQAADELLARTKSLCDSLLEKARAEADAVAARIEANRRQAEIEVAHRRERERELASAYTVLLHAACDEAGVEVPTVDRRAGLAAR